MKRIRSVPVAGNASSASRSPPLCAARLTVKKRLVPSSNGIGFQFNSLIVLLGSGLHPLVRKAICTAEANGLTLIMRAIVSRR